MNDEAAGHLADLNAAYEVHLVALRARVNSARAAIEAESAHGHMTAPHPSANDPYAPSHEPYAPHNPYAEHALIPDTPLVANDDSPLWHD